MATALHQGARDGGDRLQALGPAPRGGGRARGGGTGGGGALGLLCGVRRATRGSADFNGDGDFGTDADIESSSAYLAEVLADIIESVGRQVPPDKPSLRAPPDYLALESDGVRGAALGRALALSRMRGCTSAVRSSGPATLPGLFHRYAGRTLMQREFRRATVRGGIYSLAARPSSDREQYDVSATIHQPEP